MDIYCIDFYKPSKFETFFKNNYPKKIAITSREKGSSGLLLLSFGDSS